MKELNEEVWQDIRSTCDQAPYSVQCAVYDAIESHGWYIDDVWPWSVVLKRRSDGGPSQRLVIYHGKERPTGADLTTSPPPVRIKRMADVLAAIAEVPA